MTASGVVAASGKRGGELLDAVLDPDGQDRAGPSEEIRRLRLDNEDLRFECARLKTSIARAQAEVASLSQRNSVLQRRLERLKQMLPSWSTPLARAILSRVRG